MMFQTKKVTVMGLGLHGGGVGVAKWLVEQGARVLITDLKTKKELGSSLEKLQNFKLQYILGRHRASDFKTADLIIKNPGVPKESPYLGLARADGIPIETDISLFFRFWPGKIIGVTGTRGKSTTATLIYQILKKAKLPAYLAGNIGQSVLNLLSIKTYSEKTFAVLELSSWQLEDAAHIKRSPDIAIITNIFPDHLDRYQSFAAYVQAKKNIFRFQKSEDYLLLNRESPFLRKLARESRARVKWFRGQFHGANANAAALAAKILKVPGSVIASALKDFPGLEHRLEHCHTWRGIRFYNDSAATSPEATIMALKNFDRKPILIAGGADKNLDYKELAHCIKLFAKIAILLPGTASHKLWEVGLPTVDLTEALKLVKKIAKSGDIVLFSPAAASFNLFANEFDRGKKFKNYVRRIFKKD